MAREIKFMAYDKLKKKFVEVAEINFVEEIVSCWKKVGSIRSTYYAELESLELMQFTGLKDKNGKEIFEADLIESAYLVKETCKVYWDDTDAQWRVNKIETNDHQSLAGFLKYNPDSEVIGNIYSNPELLSPKPK